MEMQDAAWAKFMQSGQVTDYLQYCSICGAAQAKKAAASAKKKGKNNASEHKRTGPSGTGYS